MDVSPRSDSDMMRGLVIDATTDEPRKVSFPRTGSESLEALQAEVGGYIQVIPGPSGTSIYMNEEGKIHGLPVNEVATELFRDFLLPGDTLNGTVVVLGGVDDEGDDTSISTAQVVSIMKLGLLKVAEGVDADIKRSMEAVNDEWEIDPDAIEQAKAILGVKHPIKFIERYRDFVGPRMDTEMVEALDMGAALLNLRALASGQEPISEIDGEHVTVFVAIGRVGGYHPQGINDVWPEEATGPIVGHEIWLNTAVSAEEINSTIWHELAHAMQAERFGSLEEWMADGDANEKTYEYEDKPNEVEARHFAALYAPTLMLVRPKEGDAS